MNADKLFYHWQLIFRYLQQSNIKNTIFHGELEELHMEVPPSFDKVSEKSKMWRFKKALYGLK